MRAVWVRHPYYPNLQCELFANIKVSNRGAIRKAANCITWVWGLNHLKCEGGIADSGPVLRAWNAQVSRQHQIVGSRAQAVKNIIDYLPQEGLKRMMLNISKMGWEACPWSDENLASKKLWSPYCFRSGSNPKWTERGQVTPESCVLMVNTICNYAENLPSFCQRKLDRASTERYAELCAIALSLARETASLAPIKMSDIYAEFIAPLETHQTSAHAILSSIIAEKNPAFNVRDVPSLKKLIDSHAHAVSHTHTADGSSVMCSIANIERTSWELVQQQLLYDLEVAKVYIAKLTNWDLAVDSKRREWLFNRHSHNQKAAETFLNIYTKWVVKAEAEDMTRDTYQFHMDYLKRASIPEGDSAIRHRACACALGGRSCSFCGHGLLISSWSPQGHAC